jgi:hypothetical protein
MEKGKKRTQLNVERKRASILKVAVNTTDLAESMTPVKRGSKTECDITRLEMRITFCQTCH